MKKWQRGVLGVVGAWLFVAAAAALVWLMAVHPIWLAWVVTGMIVAIVSAMGWTWATEDDDETYSDTFL